MLSNIQVMEPGESLSQLKVHCVAEVEPDRACWKSVPPNSTVPLCTDHRSDPGVVVSARLARYARAVREWQREQWRGGADTPW